MGSCCGTQKQNANKNLEGRNQVQELQKPTQQQPQQEQQSKLNQQTHEQKDQNKYVGKYNDNQSQSKAQQKQSNDQQDGNSQNNPVVSNNQGQGDVQTNNKTSHQINQHNIYSGKDYNDNQLSNGPQSNRNMNVGGQSSRRDMLDQQQIQLQIQDNQSGGQLSNQKNNDGNTVVNKDSARQTNGIHNYQSEQINQQSTSSQKQVNQSIANTQDLQSGVRLNQIDLNKGESIDNVEQILQNKPKSQERNSQNNRSSIHKENYQQLTNTILARSDIYIFSNQQLQKSVSGKKQKGFELYSYFSEKESKLYLHELMKIQTKSTHGSTLGDLDAQNNNFTSQATQFSTYQDWTKLIEKHQTAQTQNVLDKNSKVKSNPNQEIFQSIIGMKERAWYDELVQLYKEKNGANKINMNMQETIFHKKLTIIQDHFRWFVASVANIVFNNTSYVSQYEFPPQTINQKKRKTSSNSQSGAKLCHSEKSDSQTEQLNMKTQQSQFNQIQMQLQNMPSSPAKKQNNQLQSDNPYCDVLPEAFSPLWLRGFVWRGVYLRLLSKKKGKHVKSEMKALKHIGIEYLQNDSSFKINNISNQSHIFINYILPLLSYVENSSFILYGTPFIYTKQNSQEESLVRQSGFNLYGAYNSCYLLRNLKENNLRLHHKIDENGNGQQVISNVFYIINNARDLIPKQCECNQMFMINQDINSNIMFYKPPKEGFIEINQLKHSMGYDDINFKFASLNYNQQKIEKQQFEQQQNQQFNRTSVFKLDQITFKKHGWSFKMIFMSQYDSNSFILNRRATELLSIAQNKQKDIKNVYGNVLVFAKLLNTNSLVSPAIIFSEENNSIINIPMSEQIKQQKSFFSLNVNEKRESFLANIFKKQIESIVNILDKSDVIISGKSLVDLFSKKGISMRYNMIVYSLLKTQKAKDLVGCDILVRIIKNIISECTSSYVKKFQQSITFDLTMTQKKNSSQNGITDESQEKNELYSDNLFKNLLCKYLSLLIKSDPNNEDPIGYQEIIQAINLHRLKTVHHSEMILKDFELQYFLSNSMIKEIIAQAQQNSGILMLLCQQYLQITLSPDLERNIRNDKYYFTIRNVTPKLTDICLISYKSVPYLSIKEIAYLFLIKLSQQNIEKHAQIQLPSALYKISQDKSNGFLSDAYYMPTGDNLKNLISYLNCIFGNLYSIDSEQNFFLDLYIFQLFDSFFIGKDDEEFVKNVMNEKIQPFLQNSYTFSAEMGIVIYTWIGILYETKSLLECEQSYMMALLAIHKLYGDPRGRGSTVVPWELFIVWRLSIVARLQGKKHDAEYVEEIYDSIQFSLQKNRYNFYKFNHYIYWDPFKPFELKFNPQNYEKDPPQSFQLLTAQRNNQSNNGLPQSSNALQQIPIDVLISQTENKLPFSHWTEYQSQYDENSLIMDVLTSTLRKNNNLFNWMMQNLLIFQESGTIWEISSLRAFQLSIMQNVFYANSSCSSVSSQSDKLEQNAPQTQRIDPKNKGFIQSNQSGNIVQILEKDYSTFSKKDAIGVMFSWGQNTEGQMGNVYDATVAIQSKKIKVNFPKLIVPLKDTIVTSVACGYQHSVAITYAGTVLAWGDNSHSQLGLGEKAPQSLPFPTPIPSLCNIQSISCGSEHTLALDQNGQVFSWGNGEGGLLGHGNEDICSSPKIIEALKGLNVDFIVCGGLHSLVLTKNRHVFSWGRNEGGQLGIEKKFFTNEKCYLTLPRRVKGSLEGVGVIQIAAGEAHSLALALNGQVYGWGYNMNGQIGLGTQADDAYPVYEPQLIPKLNKIDKIYSGQTFSMFMNSQKEIFCCGLNDSNQLGLEKEPIKITSTNSNVLDQYKPQDQKRMVTDVFIPKKMDCFHQIPVLHVSCGHNHSLALVVADTKHYMLFAWGMHKHAQLGFGETGQNSSVPRPITYLQDVTTYSMACGSYHSLVVANDVNRILKKDAVRTIKENQDKYDSKLNFTVQMKDNRYSNTNEFNNNNNNFENVAPSEEGKIDNPKSIQKTNQYYALGVQFS